MRLTTDSLQAAPPFCVTAEIDPFDEVDFDKWCREEHLDMLHKLPGHRRSARYQIGQRTPLTEGDPGKRLTIHEIDHLGGLSSPELKAASSTPWRLKTVKNSNGLTTRAWELIYSMGF